MKLSEITDNDYGHILEICTEGQMGIEMNTGKSGGMTQEEFARAEEVIDIFLSEIRKIAKDNEQGKDKKGKQDA